MTLGFFKSIAWVAFALVMTGCASGQLGHHTSEDQLAGWDMPQMQVLGDNGLPAQSGRYVKCGKRGCHEQKPMLFDPTKAEPTVESLHRGW